MRENRTHGSMRRREAARCRWPTGPKGRDASRRPYKAATRPAKARVMSRSARRGPAVVLGLALSRRLAVLRPGRYCHRLAQHRRAIRLACTSASSVGPRWWLPRLQRSARRSRPPRPMRISACARSGSRRRAAVRDRPSGTESPFAKATCATCTVCGRGSRCATRSGSSSSGGTGVRAAYRSGPTPRGDDRRSRGMARSATTGSRSGSGRAAAARNTVSPRPPCACCRLVSAQPDRADEVPAQAEAIDEHARGQQKLARLLLATA